MQGRLEPRLEELQEKLGVSFREPGLLERALTHPSYAFERQPGSPHNQRLEFLGDAVLSCVVAEYLFRNFPDLPEGQLTRLRAALVCEQALARLAARLELGKYLRLGRGEELSGGRTRPSNLADAFEAFVAALYLDQGWEKTRNFLYNLLKEEMGIGLHNLHPDYKTCLQELVQKKGNEKLRYEVLSESGPDHAKVFVSGVFWRGQLLGKGTGGSKKEAEQQAAKEALRRLTGKS